ncbi:MAG: ribonuclease HI family protein [Chloroflexi bacterium]|nr:ribonuclease HI family protein [Chloroflexota bacterium]
MCSLTVIGIDSRMRYRIHCDGASRGNPGEAAAGVVIFDAYGTIAGRIALRLGVMTNNQAEYHAVLAGMRLAEQLRPSAIEFRLDSELAARQLSGDWKIKNRGLRDLATRVRAAAPDGVPVSYIHVGRSENALADRLANWALDRTSPDNSTGF